MKRTKKKKQGVSRKYWLSDKQLNRIKYELSEEIVTKVGMLYCLALADKGWTDDDIADLFETVSRYTKYIDDKIVRLREVQKMIEDKTGIKMKGRW
jgi:hypothetical protein